MSTYGRNFDFRVPPEGAHRGSRYALDPAGTAEVTIGAPVVVLDDGSTDSLGRLKVDVPTGEGPKPLPGQGGVMVFEYGPSAYAGYDEQITTYSDLGTAKAGDAVQVVTGANEVKVVFRNTEDSTFLHTRSYTGVTMVDETLGGGTPTVAVGDYLTPNTSPSAANGYWKVTTTAANGWLVVTSVDATRGEVEAVLNF